MSSAGCPLLQFVTSKFLGLRNLKGQKDWTISRDIYRQIYTNYNITLRPLGHRGIERLAKRRLHGSGSGKD